MYKMFGMNRFGTDRTTEKEINFDKYLYESKFLRSNGFRLDKNQSKLERNT